MFSYIDPAIVELLLRKNVLRHVDRQGHDMAPATDEQPHLSILGPVPLPITLDSGEEAMFRWHAFVRHSEYGLIKEVAERIRTDQTRDLVPLLSTYMQVSSILTHGDFATAEAPVVRVHSCCMTSDVFGSRRCECGPQLHAAFARAVDEGAGAVIYMSSHEGRGIGLWAKAVTYLLQDMGQDTYEANTALGLPEDSRDFADAAVVLHALRPQNPAIRLLTNNPLKISDLKKGGIEIREVLPLVVGFTKHNLRYMKSKKSKGHDIPDSALPDSALPEEK
jgi:GTP cyclohydrolase II